MLGINNGSGGFNFFFLNPPNPLRKGELHQLDPK